MSEHGYRPFLPGSEVKMRLEIRHPHVLLDGAGVVFRHEEEPTFELASSGVPEATQRPAPLSAGMPGEISLAEVTLQVPARAPRGIYRVNRLWVETYGGRIHRYGGEELGELARFAFEVVEEPDAKPDLHLSYG
jgi:hypothetical protein